MYTHKRFDEACKSLLKESDYVGCVAAKLNVPEMCKMIAYKLLIDEIYIASYDYYNHENLKIIKYVAKELNKTGCHGLK